MKTTYDKRTGLLVLIPDDERDKKLIYHLMNCADLTQFTYYLEHKNISSTDITIDLGVPVDEYIDYNETESPLKLGDLFREIQIEVDRQNSSCAGRLIGFNRE